MVRAFLLIIGLIKQNRNNVVYTGLHLKTGSIHAVNLDTPLSDNAK